ncbi:MAG TPA: hypothetical protein VGB55_09805 [Tepidisphaeraceae bacterium]
MNWSTHQPLTTSPALSRAKPATSDGESNRRIFAWAAAALLMVGVLIAIASLSAFTPHWGELIKIIAVAMFVGSMVALALAMVGDVFRRH